MKPLGTLFLIPTPLFFKSKNPPKTCDFLLNHNLKTLKTLKHFVVENAKTARAHLKGLTDLPLQELHLMELNEHTPKKEIEDFLTPLLKGENMGLMSEAGCPAVADPGAWLVNCAHQKNIIVEPWIGASSILLALMASGLNGQRFCFWGYLPSESQQRKMHILKLEKESKQNQQTQIFIETPYRNEALFESLLKHCALQTQICVALNLTQETQWIKTQSVKAWQNAALPVLKNQLAVFLLLG